MLINTDEVVIKWYTLLSLIEIIILYVYEMDLKRDLILLLYCEWASYN